MIAASSSLGMEFVASRISQTKDGSLPICKPSTRDQTGVSFVIPCTILIGPFGPFITTVRRPRPGWVLLSQGSILRSVPTPPIRCPAVATACGTSISSNRWPAGAGLAFCTNLNGT